MRNEYPSSQRLKAIIVTLETSIFSIKSSKKNSKESRKEIFDQGVNSLGSPTLSLVTLCASAIDYSDYVKCVAINVST